MATRNGLELPLLVDELDSKQWGAAQRFDARQAYVRRHPNNQ